MEWIFLSEDRATIRGYRPNFHAGWTLDGWNDNIIQPALDAVLDYYKVCTSNISYLTSSLLNSFNQTVIILALCRHIGRRNIHARQ